MLLRIFCTEFLRAFLVDFLRLFWFLGILVVWGGVGKVCPLLIFLPLFFSLVMWVWQDWQIVVLCGIPVGCYVVLMKVHHIFGT